MDYTRTPSKHNVHTITVQVLILGTHTHTHTNRAMEFIYQFIGEIANGEQALDIAAGKAYSKSLRRHHNWMVRGIFSVSILHSCCLSCITGEDA